MDVAAEKANPLAHNVHVAALAHVAQVAPQAVQADPDKKYPALHVTAVADVHVAAPVPQAVQAPPYEAER